MLAAFSTPMKARQNPGIKRTHPTLAPVPTPDTTQHQLGDFLRTRRERLSPKAPGTGRKRRTPGLQREEVAELAGIGIDWYIRLEQGRSISPSVATLDALARALQLGKAEHAHLLTLRKPLRQRLFVRERVPAALQRMVQQLNSPAYVLGRRWDVLAWNAAADALFAFSRLCDTRPQHPALDADRSGRQALVRRGMG